MSVPELKPAILLETQAKAAEAGKKLDDKLGIPVSGDLQKGLEGKAQGAIGAKKGALDAKMNSGMAGKALAAGGACTPAEN